MATAFWRAAASRWSLRATSFGGLLHNTTAIGNIHIRSDGDYDMDYVYPTDIGMLFFGRWLPQQGSAREAAFVASKADSDCKSVKRITSDKIQVISVFIEGKEININRFIQVLDTQKINSLLVK